LAGPTGPTGGTGPQGANGPFGNKFNLDTTLHASGYTIPDADTNLYYLVNNPVACSALPVINLPHTTASGAGRMVIVTPGNVPTAPGCSSVSVAAQGSDVVVPLDASSSPHTITVVSDGAGHWYVMSF
jgi:hypothetical protein